MDEVKLPQPETVNYATVKKVERSAAYPAITIEEALLFVAEIYRNFRNEFAKRDDILSLIEGSHNRFLAAASYYNLLNREKDNYQVSELYKTITNPISPKERKEALLIAFEAPKLNKQLIGKFDGDELPEESQLKAHLVRFYGITEDAAPLAGEVFLKNAKYCGVLDEKNKLQFKHTSAKIDFEDVVIEEDEDRVADQNGSSAEPAVPVAKKDDSSPPASLLLPEMVNEERVRIRLTGGKFAYLIHPLALTKNDIAILQKQIEQLELIVSSA
jgi:hypothetical protein